MKPMLLPGRVQGTVCTKMGAAQATPMEADDPTGGYMLQAGARICKSLGEEFLPYLSIVMPPLLKSAQLKPDVKVTDVDDDEDDDEDEDVSSLPEPCGGDSWQQGCNILSADWLHEESLRNAK